MSRRLFGWVAIWSACHGSHASVDVSVASRDAEPPPPSLNEEAVRIPLDGSNQGMALEGTLFRPSGTGPFPLVILNHGALGKRDPSPKWRPVEHAQWFVSRGFVVVVPMRRGNAASDGDWAEGYGPCENADYSGANVESANDIRAALTFAILRPYVDKNRILLHGMSAGGLAVLALASTSPPGVIGVLNFAGGRGSLTADNGETRHNCSPAALIAAAGHLGQTTRVPTLWLYAENDKFFPPPLAKQMFDAFHTGSPGAAFVQLPAFGEDGHNVTWKPAGIAVWTDPVERFLEQLGLPH